jgi:hypothetical protein
MVSNNIFFDQLINAMNNTLQIIVQDAKNNASWSTTIPDAIGYRPAEESSGGNIMGYITLDNKNYPEAAAFEFGSGLHRKKGSKDTYLIIPKKTNGLLVFPRSRWKNYNPPPDKDPLYFTFVQHPGVAARPFLAPAIRKNGKILRQNIRNSFLSGIQRSFRITREVIEVKI